MWHTWHIMWLGYLMQMYFPKERTKSSNLQCLSRAIKKMTVIIIIIVIKGKFLWLLKNIPSGAHIFMGHSKYLLLRNLGFTNTR